MGRIGGPIAACIARAGYDTTVFDVRDAAAAAANEAGCTVAPSAAAVGAVVDVACIVVLDAAQVRSVLFGTEGLAATAAPGTIAVVCSTVEDREVVEIAEEAAGSGIRVLDAGVTGGSSDPSIASQITMVGGDPDTVSAVTPVLEAFSGEVVHAGPLGAGMQLKVVKNLASYLAMTCASETMHLAEELGIDAELVRHLIASTRTLDIFWVGTAARPTQHRLTADASPEERDEAAALTALSRKDLDAVIGLGDRVGVDLAMARAARARLDQTWRSVAAP